MDLIFGYEGLVSFLSLCTYLAGVFLFVRYSYNLAKNSDITGTKIFFISFLIFVFLSIVSGFIEPETKEVLYIVSVLDLVSAVALLISMLGFKSFVTLYLDKS